MNIILRKNNQSEDCQPLKQGKLIAKKFRLLEKIGMGSFGIIYKTENIETGEICATKFEKISKNRNGVSLLVREIKVLMVMKGCYGFPQIGFYGRNQHYNYFIVNYLGYNFEQLVRKCGGRFKLDTCLKLAVQMLNRIQVLHSKNLIHRDIKPENFVIDFKNPQQLNIIDFGLSKYYKDTNGTHIPQTDKKGLIGTARFASVNSHKGNEQSRRDDMEAIGYVLVYLAKGALPWMNLQIDSYEEKLQKILETKLDTSMQVLCQGLPDCFLLYFQHIMSLRFTESPNYELLKESFQGGIKEIYEKTIQNFDWLVLQEFQNQDISDNNRRCSAKKTLLQKQEEKSNSILRDMQKNNSIRQLNFIQVNRASQNNYDNMDISPLKFNQQNVDIQKQRSLTPGKISKNPIPKPQSNMAVDTQIRKSRNQNVDSHKLNVDTPGQRSNMQNKDIQRQNYQLNVDTPGQRSNMQNKDNQRQNYQLNVDTPGQRSNMQNKDIQRQNYQLNVDTPGQRSNMQNKDNQRQNYQLNVDTPGQRSNMQNKDNQRQNYQLNVDTPGQVSNKLNLDNSRNKSSLNMKDNSPGQRSNKLNKNVQHKPSQFKRDSLLLQKNTIIRQNSEQKSSQEKRNFKKSQAQYNQNDKFADAPQTSKRKQAFRIDSLDEMKNKSSKKQDFSYERIIKSIRDDSRNGFKMNRNNRCNSDQRSVYSNESLIMVIDMLSNIQYSGNLEESLKKSARKKNLKKDNSGKLFGTVVQNHKYIREAFRLPSSVTDFDEFDNLHLMEVDKFDIIVNQTHCPKKLTNIMNS